MKMAFKKAYKLTDQVLEFGGNEKSRVRWSGCSALSLVAEDATELLLDSFDASLYVKTEYLLIQSFYFHSIHSHFGHTLFGHIHLDIIQRDFFLKK
jgi:hypothetical protein